jgi:hypothetical protein
MASHSLAQCSCKTVHFSKDILAAKNIAKDMGVKSV